MVTAVLSGPAVAGVPDGEADGMELGGSVMTGVTSTYVFQGKNQGNGVFAPTSVTGLRLTLDRLGPGELSAGLSLLAPIHNDSAALEVHPSVGYELPIGIAELDVDYAARIRTDASESTNHYLDVEVTFGEDWVVEPSVGLTWDLSGSESLYVFGQLASSGLIGSQDVLGGSLKAGARLDDGSIALAEVTLQLNWTHLFGAGWFTFTSLGASYSGDVTDKKQSLSDITPIAAVHIGYLF